MPKVDYFRQKGLLNPVDFVEEVHIMGAGATGSFLTLILAKMGIIQLNVYDFDKVENHNLPNQAYGLSHIGMPKLAALQNVVSDQTGIDIIAHDGVINGKIPVQGIVCNCFDSMAARRHVWESVKYNILTKMYIESRMGIRHGYIFALDPSNPSHIDKYEATLYADDKAKESACNERAISPTVTLLSSIMANKFVKFARDEKYKNRLVISTDFLRISANDF